MSATRLSPNVYRERRGAHRPPGAGSSVVVPWVLATIAIIAIVAAVGSWFSGPVPGGNTVTAAPSSSASTGTVRPSPTGSASPAPTSSPPTSAPAGAVDRRQSITVLNGTGRAGLAGAAASRLRAAGWTIRATGNSRRGDGATTVYYGRPRLRAAAAAVAADLGGGAAVRESADFGATRITVVLGPDFQG